MGLNFDVHNPYDSNKTCNHIDLFLVIIEEERYDLLKAKMSDAKAVFDTRNAMKNIKDRSNIELL